jgi:adenosine deaminase
VIAKAEIHCHLEGSITPTLALELAQRNGVVLPEALFAPDGSYLWRDFLSFLAAYDRVCTALKTPRDFGDVIYAYLAQAAAHGAVYVEMFCSPERPKGLGIPYETWLAALADGIDRAGRDFGIVGRIIVIFIRHF